MVGSVTEILLALAVVVLLAGMLRWTFGSGQKGALPEPGGDVGLLETVTTVGSRETAEVLSDKLARAGIRTTLARAESGWRLLAFPADAQRARDAI